MTEEETSKRLDSINKRMGRIIADMARVDVKMVITGSRVTLTRMVRTDAGLKATSIGTYQL